MRTYKIPAALAKAGKGVITIRAIDYGGEGGIHGEPQQMYIGELERELAVMKNSRSWKVTRPFRKVVRRVRNNSRKGLEK